MNITETRTACIYGITGSSKTSQLAFTAKWLWDKFKLRTRLIIADPGGSQVFHEEGLVEDGIVQTFDLIQCKFPIAYLNRLSKGYWPNGDLDDEGNELIKSDSSYYNFDQPYAYMFDSISGIAQYLQEHVSNPEQNVAYKLGTVADEDGYRFGTLAQGHYNIIHKALCQAFEHGFRRKEIPYFFATAGVVQMEKKASGYFPSSVGQATSKEIPSWFNDTFHLSNEVVPSSIVARQLGIKPTEENINSSDVKVVWFQSHNDPTTNLSYSAKIRISAKGLIYVRNKYPEGFVVLDLDYGIVRLFNYLEMVRKQVKDLREKERKASA